MDILLLVLHGAAAILITGSATHNAVLSWKRRTGRPLRAATQRRYILWSTWSFLATFVLGLLVYPAFRVYVRAATFDAQLPLATGFFEVKEHLASVGLILLFYLSIASRSLPRSNEPQAQAPPQGHNAGDTELNERRRLWFFDIASFLFALIIWAEVLIGLSLVPLAPLVP